MSLATGTRLCLSMSDFHPETWNPGWSVATVAKGLLSFMARRTPRVHPVSMRAVFHFIITGLFSAVHTRGVRKRRGVPYARA